MADIGGRRGRGTAVNAWPGYVDALSTLLMVIIFVLLVFVLAQGFLSVTLSTRDRALDRLNRQVSELSELLALERGTAEELRGSLSRSTEELRATAVARDELVRQLSALREERDRIGGERDAARTERDRAAARLADLELASRGASERVASLEQRLAEALARAEAMGADAARIAGDLAETRRGLAAEQTARGAVEGERAELQRQLAAEQSARRTVEEQRAALQSALGAERTTREATERERTALEQQVAALRAELDDQRRMLAAMRQQAAELDRQVQADRETIEARLSDVARLSEQIRALAALRDQLERQAQAALDRAGEEERLRRLAEAAQSEQERRRQAAEVAQTEEERRRRAAEAAQAAAVAAQAEAAAAAAAAEQRRLAAEAGGAEQVRLAESARAQVALLAQQIEALRAELSRVAGALEAAETAGRDKDVQIANLGSRLNAALAARVEELQRYRSDFFGRLRGILGERPEVRIVGDRFVFQSEVLFPVGSAELTPSGERQIRDLARALLEIAQQIPPDIRWVMRVDGHADRQPIRSARFASNWELSAARAIAVAQILIQEGLPPNRVAATAFGDTQPLDTADTPDAYARNRRIELRLTDR
jgi:chemotaxis protein MotB